jgi:chromodomain-helicase-DNA-binding protein 1
MSFENGHLPSPDEPTYATLDTKPSRSESELSDVNDIPDQAATESVDQVMHDVASPRSDEDEDADGSDDGDYDAPSPPSRASVESRHSSVSSDASSLPRKRKAEPEPDVDDDQYMQENPELYGLRRSVSQAVILLIFLLLTSPRVVLVQPAESCVFAVPFCSASSTNFRS